MSVEASICWLLIPWLFTAYRLFSIRRIIDFQVAGEVFESLRSPLSTLRMMWGVETETQERAEVFHSPLVIMYLNIIIGLFFFQTGLFLALPLYVNYTTGGVVPIIALAMVSVIILIASPSFFMEASKASVVLVAFAYFVGFTFYLIPQLGFYMNYVGADKIKLVPASTARIVNEIKAVEAKQQEEINNARLRQGLALRKANPGKDLPPEYKTISENASKIISLDGNSQQVASITSEDEKIAKRRKFVYGK